MWLESGTNGLLAQSIVDFYRLINKNGNIRRFKIEQLTVIGKTTREGDFQAVSPYSRRHICPFQLGGLILLSRQSLEAIRLSHTRVNTEVNQGAPR